MLDAVKYLFEAPWHDASIWAGYGVPLHREGLSSTGLAVCKDGAIEAFEDGIHYRCSGALKEILLTALRAEDSIEGEEPGEGCVSLGAPGQADLLGGLVYLQARAAVLRSLFGVEGAATDDHPDGFRLGLLVYHCTVRLFDQGWDAGIRSAIGLQLCFGLK